MTATLDDVDTDALPIDSVDDLAGVVDLFGALTRAELASALGELAYRRGVEMNDEAVETAVDAALAGYVLVEFASDAVDRHDGGEGTADRSNADEAVDADEATDVSLFTVGPTAFPTLPPEAEDLPRILDISARDVTRESLVRDVEARLRGDAARAVVAEDDDRVDELLDVTYDLEAWAPVDVSEVRERLDDALQR